MEEYKAREVVLSDCVGDNDDYHYGSHHDDCTDYYDYDDPVDYDDCRDCHLSIHDLDEPDYYELYHDLHGYEGCGEYCVSHGDANADVSSWRDICDMM